MVMEPLGRVLVVDDDEAKRYVIARILTVAGFEVLHAGSAKDAFEGAAQQPDLIIMDVALPDGNGIDVCERLKANPATAGIPVVVVSAVITEENLKRALDRGADGYLPHLVDPRFLVAHATVVVRLRQAARRRERLLAESELRKAASEERLRLAVDTTELGTWDYDLTSGKLACDARSKALFGLPPDEEVSYDLFLAGLHPDDRERIHAAVQGATAKGSEGTYDVEYRTVGLRDGGIQRWVAAKGRAYFDAEGNALRFIGTLLDITERQVAQEFAVRIQETTAALSRALRQEDVAAALVDHGLHVLGASGGSVYLLGGDTLHLLRSFGYAPEEISLYQTVPLAVPGPMTETVNRREAVYTESPEQLRARWPDIANKLMRPNKAWVAVPIATSDGVLGAIGMSFPTPRRLTAQGKAYVEVLAQLAGQALQRARLYEEALRAKQDAQRRIEFEEQFVGIVSHDLRQPLQVIALGARMLQAPESTSAETQLRAANRIANNARTMERIISDLLDFTRGRLGGGIPLTPAEEDLTALAQTVVEEMSTMHPAAVIELTGPASCPGRWDGPRLRQVLTNLLGNALRHAAPETAIRVSVAYVGGHVELAVHNRGEPIPPEALPTIFEAYKQRIGGRRPGGSLGLGLFIVRSIVEGHGGSVSVTSDQASGTTFTVRLPQRSA